MMSPIRRAGSHERKRAFSRRSALGLGALLGALVGCSPPSGETPAISWVSTDRSAFDPQKSEVLTLRFRISSPGEVTVRWVDPFEHTVRTIRQGLEEAGDHHVVWDGLDDTGAPVPPEAYVYTISARALGADESADANLYDPRHRTGGEPVPLKNASFDPEARRLTYVLRKPSRVRLILARDQWPIKTLADWEPKPAGQNEVSWSADDEIGPRPTGVVFHAFALPENAVFVGGASGSSPARGNGPAPASNRPWVETDRELQEHARHDRAQCYNPRLNLEFPQTTEPGPGGVRLITEAVPLTVEAIPVPKKTAVDPSSRSGGRVFLYRDGTLLEEAEGELPYEWLLEPSELGAGEHVLTVAFSWPEDHFGFAHVKVRVDDTGNDE